MASDSTGASEIAALQDRLDALERERDAALERSIDQANRADKLACENGELKKKCGALRKKRSSLEWDVAVAHSYGRELERKLAKCEKSRFEWARMARRLGRSLKEARAEARALRAQASRSPSNSSLPPSAEPNRKKVPNSRVPSGRAPGGQKGHAGHARKRREPDERIVLDPPDVCPHCAGACAPAARSTRRQVTELVVSAHTIEYVAPEAKCAKCGAQVSAPFPAHAPNEANWGPTVKASVVFLTHGCNVSVRNAVGLLREWTGGEIDVSEGAACNFAGQLSRLSQDDIASVKAALASARVVASDATQVRSAGRSSYVYTFNSSDAALFRASSCKGARPLAGSPIDGGAQIVVHDRDRACYSFGGAHAECNVHVLRYLKGVMENEPERTWAHRMREALREGLILVKEARQRSVLPDARAVEAIESRYDDALECAASEYERDGPFDKRYKPEGIALAARLAKYRENHLLFLHDMSVPFDNNASERMLRCCKKKVKQSGGFRSFERGQKPYCDYLTVTETAKLQGESPYRAVLALFEGRTGSLPASMQSD